MSKQHKAIDEPDSEEHSKSKSKNPSDGVVVTPGQGIDETNPDSELKISHDFLEELENSKEAENELTAEGTKVVVLKFGDNIIFYLEGFTSGFGGRLTVEPVAKDSLKKVKIISIMGDTGINPGGELNPNGSRQPFNFPVNFPTRTSLAFHSKENLDFITTTDSDSNRENTIKVIEVRLISE